MNALEHQLDYPYGDTLPEPGHVFDVAPGVKWLRMPLPFALDHINLWLLRDEIDGQPGWTVVDCGITNDTIKAHWEQVFETALEGLPVLRVLVTHCHPDHIGLAQWICTGGDKQRWDVRLWTTLGEYTSARVMASGEGSNAGGEGAARHFARHGLARHVARIVRRARPAAGGDDQRSRHRDACRLAAARSELSVCSHSRHTCTRSRNSSPRRDGCPALAKR